MIHSRASHTILVTHTLADRDAAFVVRVLEHHDFSQFDTEAVGHELGELSMAVAGQEFDRVGSHLGQNVSCRWLGQLGIMVESIRSQSSRLAQLLEE